MNVKFGGWSTEALRGYVVILSEFLSGSIQEEPQYQQYVDRLASARVELRHRESMESGKKMKVFFVEEETKADEPAPS